MSITPTLTTESDFLTVAYRYYGKLLSEAFKLTRNSEDAQDLVQDTFIRAHQKQSLYKEQGTLGGWLCRMMRNIYLERAKGRGQIKVSFNSDQIKDDHISLRPAYNSAVTSITIDEARTAIRNLPAELQKVFEPYVMDDCRYQDVAKKLSLPLGSVKAYIHMARRDLVTGPLREYAVTKERQKRLKDFCKRA